MTWIRKEIYGDDGLTIFAQNTETKEERQVHIICLPTMLEKITGSNRYKKQWIHATHAVNMFCIDMNSTEMLARITRPHLPDKTFMCGWCGADSWNLRVMRGYNEDWLQFNCSACGHSDNIISYDGKVSNIEKLVDADTVPNGSRYNPSIEYVSGRG